MSRNLAGPRIHRPNSCQRESPGSIGFNDSGSPDSFIVPLITPGSIGISDCQQEEIDERIAIIQRIANSHKQMVDQVEKVLDLSKPSLQSMRGHSEEVYKEWTICIDLSTRYHENLAEYMEKYYDPDDNFTLYNLATNLLLVSELDQVLGMTDSESMPKGVELVEKITGLHCMKIYDQYMEDKNPETLVWIIIMVETLQFLGGHTVEHYLSEEALDTIQTEFEKNSDKTPEQIQEEAERFGSTRYKIGDKTFLFNVLTSIAVLRSLDRGPIQRMNDTLNFFLQPPS